MNTSTVSAAERLVAAAAVHAGAEPAQWSRRVERLLGVPLEGLTPQPERSALNSGGMPLQLCVSFSAGPARSRLICDPYFSLPDPASRHAASLSAAMSLCAEAGVGRAAERVLGHRRLAAGHSPVGPLWLAFSRPEAGMALYLNCRPANAVLAATELSDWQCFLDEVASPMARTAAFACLDTGQFSLVAIGLDLDSTGVSALTLYGRLHGHSYNQQDGVLSRFVGCAAGAALLHALSAESAQPKEGVTAAVCVTVPDGRLKASKIDLCRCPRCRPQNEVPGEMALLQSDAAVAALDLARCSSLALVGVASQGQRPHVNLYLEPRTGHVGRPPVLA